MSILCHIDFKRWIILGAVPGFFLYFALTHNVYFESSFFPALSDHLFMTLIFSMFGPLLALLVAGIVIQDVAFRSAEVFFANDGYAALIYVLALGLAILYIAFFDRKGGGETAPAAGDSAAAPFQAPHPQVK